MNFKYVTKNEWKETRKALVELIQEVQRKVKPYFSFAYRFVGSSSRNMITRQVDGNIGFDFDCNIELPIDEPEFTAKQYKQIFIQSLNEVCKKYHYDYAEDSSRVVTIKVKDRKNKKVLHSCDFCIVHYYEEDDYWFEEFIFFNKKKRNYEWRQQSSEYDLEDKIDEIKENDLWQELRDTYLRRKNKNRDPNKKSRALFAEAVNEVYNRFCGEEEEETDTNTNRNQTSEQFATKWPYWL